MLLQAWFQKESLHEGRRKQIFAPVLTAAKEPDKKRKSSFLVCGVELFIRKRPSKGHCDPPAPTFMSKVLVCRSYLSRLDLHRWFAFKAKINHY